MKFVPKSLDKTADVSRGLIGRRAILKNALLVTAFFVVLYFLLGFVGEILARHIPDSWERRMGGVHLLPEKADHERLESVQDVLDRLMAAETDLRDLDYRLFLLSMDMPNAVAVPGGGIGVTTSLLEMVETDRGLAFVLAHELGHHQRRHIARRIGRGLVYGLAGAVLFGSDTFSPVSSAYHMMEVGYSRNQEREADTYGLHLVHAAFGDIDGSLEFFERMLEMEGDARWTRYFQTHPLTRERIEYLRKEADALGGGH